jgi:hypothetical protein
MRHRKRTARHIAKYVHPTTDLQRGCSTHYFPLPPRVESKSHLQIIPEPVHWTERPLRKRLEKNTTRPETFSNISDNQSLSIA